jgi:hypothetical protein
MAVETAEKRSRESMRSTDFEPLVAAPLLLNAIRESHEAFSSAALLYAAAPRAGSTDAESQECLELLDHLVERLREPSDGHSSGFEEACIYLLEHLASRLHKQCGATADAPIQ